MCYSAMAEQDLKKYGIKKGDMVDVARFRELVHRRSMGENLYIPKAMESNFVDHAESPEEKELGKMILQYRESKIAAEQHKMAAKIEVEGFKMAVVRAKDQVKMAEKSASEKLKTAKVKEQEANDKAGDLAEVDLSSSFGKILQREAKRARVAEEEAKGEAQETEKEAEEARQEAKRAKEVVDEAERDFERRYGVRRGSNVAEFFHNKESGRKSSAEKEEKEGEYTDSEEHAPG